MIDFNIDLAANHGSQIAELETELFNTNLEAIYSIDRKIKAIYVKTDDQLIGFLTFKRTDRNIEIYNFGIREQYRRQRIGSRMLNTMSAYNVSLEVRESNQVAIDFYKSQGFSESHIRKNYYGSEHAIVLERKKTMEQNAYAKINLILNVVDKLDNGMHQIEFLMNSVDLHDVVKMTESDTDEVIVTNDTSLNGLDNLAYKALEVMRQEYGFTTKYKIEIEKNIPVAAGMAGGSSDAAAVMRILNELEDINASEQKLAMLGSRVGSDVSYCIYSRLAIARGTGEQIEVVSSPFSTKYVLVVNPGVPLSTAKVYQNHVIDEQLGSIEQLLSATTDEQFEQALFNSLAPTAYKLCPEMSELYQKINKLTSHKILVSGSGPTLLVFSSERTHIEELYSALKPEYENCHIAKMQ